MYFKVRTVTDRQAREVQVLNAVTEERSVGGATFECGANHIHTKDTPPARLKKLYWRRGRQKTPENR